MVGVFAIFGTLSMMIFKQFGVGLAAAILIDATIIRAVLLPATMKLLGDWNWYLPKWLEWLPHVEHDEKLEKVEAPPVPTPVPRARCRPSLIRPSDPEEPPTRVAAASPETGLARVAGRRCVHVVHDSRTQKTAPNYQVSRLPPDSPPCDVWRDENPDHPERAGARAVRRDRSGRTGR